MNVLMPDHSTAFSMLAVMALLWAGVLALQGHKHWNQGLSWGMTSLALLALSYLAQALHHLTSGDGWPALAAALLLSTALASATLALMRFRGHTHRISVLLTLGIPWAATLGLAVWQWPPEETRFVQHHLWLAQLQCVFMLLVLIPLRRQAPGPGWWLLLVSTLCWLSAATLQLVPHAAGAAWLALSLLQGQLAGCCLGLVAVQQDSQNLGEKNASLIDALTQLPNRAALVSALEAAIEGAAQHQQPLAILVLDIDHFKSVNDSYGHLVGDQVIQHLARLLQRQGRSDDFAARYGGEEFVMVLPRTSARHAFHFAAGLCKAMRSTPVQLSSGQILHTTISVGVYAGIPAAGSSWQRLLEMADEAMYVAKRNGRDRVALSAAMHSMAPPETTQWDRHEA